MEPKKKKDGNHEKKQKPQGFNWKKLFILLGIMTGLFLFLIFIVSVVLKSYTHHSESLTVPDFKGMTVEEVEGLCKDRGLRYVIKDSVFSQDAPKHTICKQNPPAMQPVKRNRRIYLTINDKKAPLVQLPNIIDNSRRHAVQVLENEGLKASDKIEYKPDPALNAVLEVKYKGLPMQSGALLQKGSVVDLVLGDGGNNQKVDIPNLKGRSFDEAILILRGSYLNVGIITTDSGKVVSRAGSSSVVFKQEPAPDADKKQLGQGDAINIWVMPRWKYKKQQNSGE